MNAWLELVSTDQKDRNDRMSSPSIDLDSGNKYETDDILTHHSRRLVDMPAYTFTSIQEALTFVTQGKDRDFPIAPNYESTAELPASLKNANHIQVLCTGSLHLVGGALQLLDPELNSRF